MSTLTLILKIYQPSKVFSSRDDIYGMNVTIPYKQEVIPFLDEIDPVAKAIGAVNTIVFKDDKRLGYNTDHIGFQNTLLNHLKPHHNKALVLGTGGASKAVCYVLEQLKIQVLKVSRSEGPDRKAYHQLSAKDYKEHSLLINCTPLGTHPNTDAYPPIDYKQITAEHLLYDLIYNPKVTAFMQMGKDKGAEVEWISNARRPSRGLMVFVDGLNKKVNSQSFSIL